MAETKRCDARWKRCWRTRDGRGVPRDAGRCGGAAVLANESGSSKAASAGRPSRTTASSSSSGAAAWVWSIEPKTRGSAGRWRSSSCRRTLTRDDEREAAFHSRGAGRLGARPSEHLHDSRDRRDGRRPAVHRHGVLRGRDAEAAARARGPLPLERRCDCAMQIARGPRQGARRTASSIATSSRRT